MLLKLNAGKYKVPVEIIPTDSGARLFLKFRFNRTLLNEVRDMEGSKWHGYEDPPIKMWSIKNSSRNWFTLKYLQGENVYYRYDKPIEDHTPKRDFLYDHQIDAFKFVMTRKRCILGHTMGLGKTLVAIEAMEASGFKNWIWVGPKVPLLQVEYIEWLKYKPSIQPLFMTYEKLRNNIDNLETPDGIVFDESSRIKNRTAQRAIAAREMVDRMFEKHKGKEFVIEMTGTPAPKDPTNWWHQVEVACPGYLKEGDDIKLKRRLAVIKQEESLVGATYPKLICWRDSEDRCETCGKMKDEVDIQYDREGNVISRSPVHSLFTHEFKSAGDEITKLYRRLKGIVHIRTKENCLDLPDKRYEIIRVEPSVSTLRAARLISTRSPRAITALILLRELSDGFQYIEKEIGEITCTLCKGTGEDPHDVGECPNCYGEKVQPKYERQADVVECPKDKVVEDLLEKHEETGRLVIFCGFRESVDRVVALCQRKMWATLRVDGRGIEGYDPLTEIYFNEGLQEFQERHNHSKMVYVGQAGAGGIGVTLTRSPSILYYSNTFNGEDRMQSEDRIHRIGMDTNKGATIYDIIHLPSDELVLQNLQKKKRLQALSMGELQRRYDNEEYLKRT